MFNRHRATIGQVLKERATRWAKAGEQLSILDVTEEYLDEEEPERSSIVGVQEAVCVDGADTHIQAVRIVATAAAIEYGAKNQEKAARSLNWVTAAGLTFEHTPSYGARASEKEIYELHGSLGKRKAPLESWRNVASNTPAEERNLRFWVPSESMLDYHDIKETLDTVTSFRMDPDLANSAVDDGVLLTASVEEVEEMHGAKKARASSSKAKPATLKDPKVPKIKDVHDWFDMRKASKI